MYQFLIKNKEKSVVSLFLFFLLVTGHWSLTTVSYAEEMLKTSKVKVGEKVPLTDSLKKSNEEGKAIILLLLSNPMQCENCEAMDKLVKEFSGKYKDVVLIAKGGGDLLGAVDNETIVLKSLYGFVTIGQPWTFIIDREGVLKKIFIGKISEEELNDAIKLSIEKKTKKAEGDVKEFVFTVMEGNIELNGAKFPVWTYNGTIPGPEVRVKEGDTVRVKLQNKSGAKHGMFFHGLHVPPKVAMQEEVALDPGYEYIYEFEAKPSGTHLYHCSFNMAEHLDRGLYGAFIVEGKDDEKVDKEFVYIIDDWNSKAAKGESHHGIGHPRDMKDYDITTINGKSITNSPLVMGAKAGEKIRIRLISIGNLPHALRLPEGFTITHVDSYPLPEPRKENSLTLLGGQRYDIVITPEKRGKLSFYHSINFPPTLSQKLAELYKSEHKHDGHNSTSHSVNHIHETGSTEGVVPAVAVQQTASKAAAKEEIAIIIEVKD
jgi:hypothetical protein